MIEAIKYSGNVSALNDKNKIENSGLSHLENEFGPLINEFPINFCCSIVKIVRLGTHFLLLGEVEKIYIRKDVSVENPLKWNSYSEVVKIK